MATVINVPDFDQDNKVLRFHSAFCYILRSENIIAPPRLHVTEWSPSERCARMALRKLFALMHPELATAGRRRANRSRHLNNHVGMIALATEDHVHLGLLHTCRTHFMHSMNS